MFPRRYFPARMFAPRYFPQSQGTTPTPGTGVEGRLHPSKLGFKRFGWVLLLLGGL